MENCVCQEYYLFVLWYFNWIMNKQLSCIMNCMLLQVCQLYDFILGLALLNNWYGHLMHYWYMTCKRMMSVVTKILHSLKSMYTYLCNWSLTIWYILVNATMQNFLWYGKSHSATQGRSDSETPIRNPGTKRITEWCVVRAGLRGQDEKPSELHPRKPYNGCLHMGWNTLHDSQMISGLRIKGDGL